LSIVIDSGAPRTATSRSSCSTAFLVLARPGTVCVRAEARFGELVQHGQNPERPPVRKTIADEIHAPALIRSVGGGQRYAHTSGALGALLRPHLQAFLA
jgi:hypothetical protein